MALSKSGSLEAVRRTEVVEATVESKRRKRWILRHGGVVYRRVVSGEELAVDVIRVAIEHVVRANTEPEAGQDLVAGVDVQDRCGTDGIAVVGDSARLRRATVIDPLG